jgi:hypothetical protein
MTGPTRPDESIRSAMIGLLEGPAKDAVLEETLRCITQSAVALIDGVDFADLLIFHEGEARSVAETMTAAVELDNAQLTLLQGPCLEAANSGAIVRSPDMSNEARWPLFAAAAIAKGVHGMVSYQLIPRHNATGALNLFSHKPLLLDPPTEAAGALLATLATVALMAAVKKEQFETALASRDEIGQAKGILMNYYKVDAAHAFDLLKQLSQSANTPLRTIAQQVIETF